MKKLITSKIVEEFANANGGGVFPIDDNTLITPSAKDTARNRNIKFVHEDDIPKTCPKDDEVKTQEVVEKDQCCSEQSECNKDLTKEQIVAAVIKVLNEKGLLDKILN